MAISVADIIAKKHRNKWDNYPKLKEAVTGAYTSKNNWCEVELNTPWMWNHSIMSSSLTVHYSPKHKHKNMRTLIVGLR